MTTKLTKNDLKKDVVTEELQKGFVWTTKHVTAVAIFLAGFMLVGAGYSAVNYFSNKKEEQSQETFYQVEREYLAQKAKFDQFEKESAKPKETKAAKNAKEQVKETDKEPGGVKASGDLLQDYGSVVAGLEQIISANPSSKAAAMASLTVSEIYSKYAVPAKAIASLDKIPAGADLLNLLVLDRKAGLKADSGDCKAAIGVWDQILNQKTAKFMSADLKLKKGLCFESLNDIAQAQAMYTQAKEGNAQSPVVKNAEKYLLLLQTKQTKKN